MKGYFFAVLLCAFSGSALCDQVLVCHDTWQQKLQAKVHNRPTACEQIAQHQADENLAKQQAKAKQDVIDSQRESANHFAQIDYEKTDDFKKIVSANAMHDGRINVATYTPNFISGRKFIPWKYLGDVDSKSFWYNFSARGYGVDITIKSATNSIEAGKFSDLQFVVGHMNCPMHGYPLGIDGAHTYVNSPINGVTLSGDVEENPYGSEIPAARGSVLAKAIVESCDRVVSAGGTAVTVD